MIVDFKRAEKETVTEMKQEISEAVNEAIHAEAKIMIENTKECGHLKTNVNKLTSTLILMNSAAGLLGSLLKDESEDMQNTVRGWIHETFDKMIDKADAKPWKEK